MVNLEQEILLDRETIIVSETNHKGVITYANEDFCLMCGYTKDDLIGQPHNVVRHADMPKAAFKDLWSTVQSGKVWTGIVKNSTRDGGFYWVKATVYPSKGDGMDMRYFSVRVKPTKSEVEEAELLYSKLS